MDARNDPDEHGDFDEAAHAAFLEFQKRLDDPAADRTVPVTLNIPIKWAALMHWCSLRHNQRWADDPAPPDGDFSFDFTKAQWDAIRRDLENTLNNVYEDQFHALNNGFEALLTNLSKNERKYKDASDQADLPGLTNPNDPDDGIPF